MSALQGVTDFKPVLKGALTWIPGVHRLDRYAAGGTGTERYCYGVWIKHLSLLWQAGMRTMPRTVAELGPGKSLGTGLAALLSGVERYCALDVVRHASVATTAPLLEPMTELFRSRAACPPNGFPDYSAVLDARNFPSEILTEERLDRALASGRLAELAKAVQQLDAEEQHAWLRYNSGRNGDLKTQGGADLLFSHVVLDLIDDLEAMYRRCASWLAPGGWMSHLIDFTSHKVTSVWNGHLKYSDALWRIINGQRPFFVNRERLADHLALLEKTGFELVSVQRLPREGGITRSELAPRFREISDEDLSCSLGYVIARKRAR
ncbi:MAG: hypothetical protein ABR570_11375 [Burkholderiales bacterium]